MTKYRNYKEPYSIDVKRFSIYSKLSKVPDRDSLNVGDEIDVMIKDIDSNGRGISFYRGYKIIVPKGFIDERVRVRIVKIVDEGLLGVIVHRYGDGTKGK